MADSYELQKRIHEELKKAASSLPPQLQDQLLNNLSKWKSSDKSLSILLTGKTGSGKSTLVNGILGLKKKDTSVAKEGSSIKERCTTEVAKYAAEKNGVTVTVWDSPGLQDGTEHQDGYLQQMKENCSEVDLVMYCTKVTETRFVQGVDNPDVVAMKKITKAFGHAFWQKTVIILTYANMLDDLNMEWEDLETKEEKADAFNAKIKEWEEQIKVVLTKDVKIPNKIIDQIMIVPAGHQRKPDLTGQELWLSHLWFQCLFSIPSVETRCALLQINLDRFKKGDEVEKEKFRKKPPEEQPIVVTDHTVRNIVAGSVGGSASGGTIGGIIGAFFGGPFGAAVGAGIGALIGGGTGGSIGKAWS